MSPLSKGIIYAIIAQVLTFLQFQGGLKMGWTEKHPWLLALFGVPISYLFMMSVKYFVQAFNGELWPSRLLGFGIGTIIFTLLSYVLFNESISMKTAVCLLLGICIVILQIYWK